VELLGVEQLQTVFVLDEEMLAQVAVLVGLAQRGEAGVQGWLGACGVHGRAVGAWLVRAAATVVTLVVEGPHLVQVVADLGVVGGEGGRGRLEKVGADPEVGFVGRVGRPVLGAARLGVGVALFDEVGEVGHEEAGEGCVCGRVGVGLVEDEVLEGRQGLVRGSAGGGVGLAA